jgi:hypothetical protein
VRQRTPAQDSLAVGIAKRLRDIHGVSLPLATRYGDTIAEYLGDPGPLGLLTDMVAQLHAASLTTEARPTGEGS